MRNSIRIFSCFKPVISATVGPAMSRLIRWIPVTGEVNTSAYEWAAAPLLAGKTENKRVIATYNGATGIPFQYKKTERSSKGPAGS